METCHVYFMDNFKSFILYIQKGIIDGDEFDNSTETKVVSFLFQILCLQFNAIYGISLISVDMIYTIWEKCIEITADHFLFIISILMSILCIFTKRIVMKYITQIPEKTIYKWHLQWKIKNIKPAGVNFLQLLPSDVIGKIVIDYLPKKDMMNFMRCSFNAKNVIYNHNKYKWLMSGYRFLIYRDDLNGIKYLYEYKKVRFEDDCTYFEIINDMSLQCLQYLSENSNYYDIMKIRELQNISFSHLDENQYIYDDDYNHKFLQYHFNLRNVEYPQSPIDIKKAIYIIYAKNNDSLCKKYRVNSFLFIIIYCDVTMLNYHISNYTNYNVPEPYYVKMDQLLHFASKLAKFDMIYELMTYAKQKYPGKNMNTIVPMSNININ